MIAWLLIACNGSIDTEVQVPGDSDTDVAAGELRIVQLRLGGFATGESTLIVGPDGTAVLIDVGNDSHADDVLQALQDEIGSTHVGAVVLTHYHGDHLGGLDKLLEQGLTTDALVVRGDTGLDGGANRDEIASISETSVWTQRISLCSDAGCTLPWVKPLGNGAELVITVADGWALGESGPIDGHFDFPADDDGENARSLGGIVRFGSFTYAFAGDLTGGGKGTPDVETFVASTLSADLIDATGVDVLHLSHHGINSSTNDAWINRMFPNDGAERHAVVGTNGTYLDAPADEVLDRLRERLYGGKVWVGEPGSLVDEDDPLLNVVGGRVWITAHGDGSFSIRG